MARKLTKKFRHKSGYNAKTEQVIIVINPEDVMEATGTSRDCALHLMRSHADSLVCGYHKGWDGEWSESISSTLEEAITKLK